MTTPRGTFEIEVLWFLIHSRGASRGAPLDPLFLLDEKRTGDQIRCSNLYPLRGISSSESA
jgi:hypothetical protein